MAPSSSSCLRCKQPLALDSARGLCQSCSQALETSRPLATAPGSNTDRRRSQLEGANAATLTAGCEVDYSTAAWSGPVRMRAAPAGYDLMRYLGGGGMGDVYLAREHAAERIVAIKFLRLSGNPTSQDRFLKEVRALGRIEHPNVVRIISVDVDRGDPYYTMEYGAGGTIADRIKAEGPFEPHEAARLCIQLADALATAHDARTLHRDIKPSNVVLTADGTPKLSDFGLAKLMDTEDDLTRTTQAIGTAAFMPPEQISRKFGDYGPPTDVYGLGATLYAMLTGKAPFEGDSNEDIISKVKSNQPPRPRMLCPNLPMALEAVVLKCLEKRPANRYASAAELAADLERFLAGAKPSAPQLTPTRRLLRWAARAWIPLGTAVAAVAIALIVIAREPQSQAESLLPPDLGGLLTQELDQKKRVELLDSMGLPKWHNWRLGDVVLEKSKDGVGSFQTQSLSMLDVIPKVELHRYRFSTDIQHYTGKENGAHIAGPDRVGIYFGAAESQSDEARCLSQFVVRFKDLRIIPPPPAKEFPPRAEFLALSLTIRPGELPDLHPGSIVAVPVASTTRRPGIWRNIVVDVTPDSVQAYWRNEEGRLVAFPADSSMESTRSQFRSPQIYLNRAFLKPPSIPKWDGNGPLGIFAQQSTVKFRNVTVEMLPDL
jgi:eukaryotic-like serine/threonine-protein kinase